MTQPAGNLGYAKAHGHQTSRLAPRTIEGTRVSLSWGAGTRAIEDEEFPFEVLSRIAEVESWRKEIYRPNYHIHKWWAQRLGSVFRAITLACFAPHGTDVVDLFYRPVRIPGAVVFDPFMGSGTTLGEALKLGARAIGRDINPVAHFLVRNALAIHDHSDVQQTFRDIERDVANRLRHYYRTTLPDGRETEVLYYFWVKRIACPSCTAPVDLFSSRVFARHAYAKRYPQAQAVCPHCGAVNKVLYNASEAACTSCNRRFDPQQGNARGQTATCPRCTTKFTIAKTVRTSNVPPDHHLYAKLVLMPDGTKAYLPATVDDRKLYDEAAQELTARRDPYPVAAIEPGHNTNQALGYNYRHWHEMFNARQLLGLSILSERISHIEDLVLRELFACLLSGTLEFNNMFASYKGEGTGAVRHMFAHHILKPERTPLEANLWGTPKSSGSFLTMFEGRIKRALDYADDPFELRVTRKKGRDVGEKVYGLSDPMKFDIAESHETFDKGRRVYLSCGDSSKTDLPANSVDAVITDPPFFDNVHYSELADFFHVWQQRMLGREAGDGGWSTRSTEEVQNSDADTFTVRLAAVFAEAHRVLKDDSLLVFTYHHSRAEGWHAILEALMGAGFGITATQPIKSEMSVAMPKHQANEPIDLDVVIVCRKRSWFEPQKWNGNLWEIVSPLAQDQVARLRGAGRRLSRNDVRVILMSQLLRQLSMSHTMEAAIGLLEAIGPDIEARIDDIYSDANDEGSGP